MAIQEGKIRYSIFDPTGNITALVETEVDIPQQPSVAASIMKCHPEVEQVGFVEFYKETVPATEAKLGGKLRMAGGEFCGNAAMSAAALYLIRNKISEMTVSLNVSGASAPVPASLSETAEGTFSAGVLMPPASGIKNGSFSFGGMTGTLPVVMMEGISHIIIEKDSVFFSLLDDRSAAELAVREWCAQLGTDGLGLMFLDHKFDAGPLEYDLTPLVYVPGSSTVFWENSCASGSAAAGIFIAGKTAAVRDISVSTTKLSSSESKIPEAGTTRLPLIAFTEPGGRLCVKSDAAAGKTWLFGNVRLVNTYY